MITDKDEVILFDFGTAVEIKPGSTLAGIGTRGYAAPEQYTSNYDQRVDIFGLGATLHYMLTGHNPSELPYTMLPITHYDVELSKGLEYVVDKCLKKSPKDRYQDCASLIEDLQNYGDLPPKKGFLFDLFSKKNKPDANEVKKENSQTGSSKLRVVRCKNGHFYDAAQYDKCPHCDAPEKSYGETGIPPKPLFLPPKPLVKNDPRVWFVCPKCQARIEKHDYRRGDGVTCWRCGHVLEQAAHEKGE